MQIQKINWRKITTGKAAVFIDAANVLYSQKTLGFKVDYKKLRDYLSSDINVSGFYYYTGKVGKLEKQLKFIKRFSGQYDTLILCSGDSDFAYLVDLLKAKGKRVITLSTRGHISRELIERTKYIDLRKLRNFIEFAEKNQEPAEAAPEV